MPNDVKLNAEGVPDGVRPNGPYHALAEALRNHHFRLYGTNPVTGPGSCIAEAADILDEIESASALSAAHSQHEADVARIGELTDIADELDHWVKAALDCKDWHWDGDQREAAEHARSRFASALAKVKP